MTTYDQQMPTNYDAPVQQQPSGTLIDRPYMTSLKGILKAAEIGLSLIAVITSSVWESSVCCTGGGWAQFVSMTALICTAILYVLYIFGVAEKLRAAIGIYNLFELIFHASLLLLYFIAAVVAAAFGAAHASIGATAFFAFAALVPYSIDTFFAFQTWRSQPPVQAPSPQAPGNMDTVSSVERGPQY